MGSRLTQLLLAGGHRVRVLDNLRWGGESLLGVWGDPRFDFVRGDVTSPEDRERALRGVETVVHLAAIVGDPACKAEPELAEAVNLGSTKALLEEARQQGARRFFFASTCSNYGVASSTELAHEDSPLNPVSLYAQTKVAAEKLLLGAEGIETTVLRLATVYGLSPRMRFDLTVNEFARDAALGRKLVIFGEQHWRPYVHVYDAARGFARLLEVEPRVRAGQVFNLGDTDENYQKLGLSELLKERLPDLQIEFVKTGPDPRSYKVTFEKIRKVLDYHVERRVPQGLDEVIALTRNGVIPVDDARWSNT